MAFLEIKDDSRKTLVNIEDILLVQEDFGIGYTLIHIRDLKVPLRVKVDYSTIADKITEDKSLIKQLQSSKKRKLRA